MDLWFDKGTMPEAFKKIHLEDGTFLFVGISGQTENFSVPSVPLW